MTKTEGGKPVASGRKPGIEVTTGGRDACAHCGRGNTPAAAK
jgi:hypothetical protein